MGKALHILSSTASVADIRKETYLGREHLVVPVVALVQGVLHASNAEEPELALAEEFGKVPQAWDGRPVVLNHPKDSDGVPISANSPGVLAAQGFGYMFNTQLDGNKLKTEAWLDLYRVEELGGEYKDLVEKMLEGTTVEVSTGLFTTNEAKPGTYEGTPYSAIWRNIIPDHLAILSTGLVGACSNEAGCGAPRINEASLMAKTTTEEQPLVVAPVPTPVLKDNCTCDRVEPKNMAGRLQLVLNSYPDGMTDRDVRTLLQGAVEAHYGEYAYVMMFTSTACIYQGYDKDTFDYDCYSVDYTIAADTSVTFTSTPVEVNVLTNIVPVQESKDETTMANNAASVPGTAVAAAVDPANPNPTPVVLATPVVAEVVKPRTLSEYVADAPVEVREMLEDGLRAMNERKASVIKDLMATNRCDYTETELKAMSLKDLDRLAKIASVPVYASAGSRDATSLTANADGDSVPDAPRAFTAAA